MTNPNMKNVKSGSDLKALRDLAPRRQLTWTEEQAIAARQATRLRHRHDVNHTPIFDDQIIFNQTKLQVVADPVITVAGLSHWTKAGWRILINDQDHPYRQRFTLAHEYKHIIDHGRSINPEHEERICDYFAACLLMPKHLVIAAWTQGQIDRTVTAMARAFAVSTTAMNVRLNQLGLTEPRPRCPRQPSPPHSDRQTRASSTTVKHPPNPSGASHDRHHQDRRHLPASLQPRPSHRTRLRRPVHQSPT